MPALHYTGQPAKAISPQTGRIRRVTACVMYGPLQAASARREPCRRGHRLRWSDCRLKDRHGVRLQRTSNCPT
jgi:hypothetical protein